MGQDRVWSQIPDDCADSHPKLRSNRVMAPDASTTPRKMIDGVAIEDYDYSRLGSFAFRRSSLLPHFLHCVALMGLRA